MMKIQKENHCHKGNKQFSCNIVLVSLSHLHPVCTNVWGEELNSLTPCLGRDTRHSRVLQNLVGSADIGFNPPCSQQSLRGQNQAGQENCYPASIVGVMAGWELKLIQQEAAGAKKVVRNQSKTPLDK